MELLILKRTQKQSTQKRVDSVETETLNARFSLGEGTLMKTRKFAVESPSIGLTAMASQLTSTAWRRCDFRPGIVRKCHTTTWSHKAEAWDSIQPSVWTEVGEEERGLSVCKVEWSINVRIYFRPHRRPQSKSPIAQFHHWEQGFGNICLKKDAWTQKQSSKAGLWALQAWHVVYKRANSLTFDFILVL